MSVCNPSACLSFSKISWQSSFADRGHLLLRTPGPSHLGLAYVLLVETNPFLELVVIFPDYAIRTSLGTFSIFFRYNAHLFHVKKFPFPLLDFVFSVAFLVIALIVYLVLYIFYYKISILPKEDIDTGFGSTAHLDYSFYLLVGGVGCSAFNFLLLLLSGLRMSCGCTQEAEKIMDNGIILYWLEYLSPPDNVICLHDCFKLNYCGWLYFRGYQFSWIELKWLIRGVRNLWPLYFPSWFIQKIAILWVLEFVDWTLHENHENWYPKPRK